MMYGTRRSGSFARLDGIDQTDPLERDFYQTLAAYEQLLTEKNGRKTSASRTRQKLKNKGVVRCLEDWAEGSTPTEGFDLFIRNRMAELTGEYEFSSILIDFPRKPLLPRKPASSPAGLSLLPRGEIPCWRSNCSVCHAIYCTWRDTTEEVAGPRRLVSVPA